MPRVVVAPGLNTRKPPARGTLPFFSDLQGWRRAPPRFDPVSFGMVALSRGRSPIPAALLLAACWVAPAAAQQEAAGVRLTGVVVDATSGAPVRGALVSLGGPGPRALTDSLGAFRVQGVRAGQQTVRVQRFGYRTLERPITVSAATPPLDLRLDPDPLQLEGLLVTSGVRLPLDGVVTDAVSGVPVPWAELELTRDAVREESRGESDARGAFSLPDVPTGAYFLLVEKLGYESQYVAVGHTTPPSALVVKLGPDTAIQRGLAFMAAELTRRRNALPSAVRVFDETQLRVSRAPSLRDFLEQEASAVFVRCGPAGQFTCMLGAGGMTQPRVYIDDLLLVDGGGALPIYDPAEMHSVELFRCSRPEIRIYTSDYMLRMARRPRVVRPACTAW
jgi:hypothetical protein